MQLISSFAIALVCMAFLAFNSVFHGNLYDQFSFIAFFTFGSHSAAQNYVFLSAYEGLLLGLSKHSVQFS